MRPRPIFSSETNANFIFPGDTQRAHIYILTGFRGRGIKVASFRHRGAGTCFLCFFCTCLQANTNQKNGSRGTRKNSENRHPYHSKRDFCDNVFFARHPMRKPCSKSPRRSYFQLKNPCIIWNPARNENGTLALGAQKGLQRRSRNRHQIV